MSITETMRPGSNGTSYRCVLLRQSYREGGQVKNRTIGLRVDAEAQREAAKLDGCYVLTTDLPRAVAETEVVHER